MHHKTADSDCNASDDSYKEVQKSNSIKCGIKSFCIHVYCVHDFKSYKLPGCEKSELSNFLVMVCSCGALYFTFRQVFMEK